NTYLRQLATQHRRRGLSQTYVLSDSDAPSAILGYYTLSAAQVAVARISEHDRKRLPGFPVPCFRMGRLAVHKERKGSGLGKLLIALAVDRCLHAREEVAAFALIVDAKDQSARSFYMHYGFSACIDRPMTLYLPLGGI
ncbi:MAG: GNAT family N-acetyltransferase, partial [Gammaproteobacteria bacterium]